MTPAELLASKKTKFNGASPKAVWCCACKTVREKLGLSTRNVALAVGMNSSTYWRIECGSDVTLTDARKLARFFGMSLEELWFS